MKYYLIVVSVLLFGISMFFRKLAVDRIHPYQVQAISGIIYILLVPLWLTLAAKQNATAYPISAVACSAACTTLYIIATICLGFLLRSSPNVGVIAALVSLSPVVTLSLSMLFLNEPFSMAKFIAFLLALASAILVNF